VLGHLFRRVAEPDRLGIGDERERSPYTEPPGSGMLSHPGSPNLSQQGHPY
jgi:hypothetical protein